MVVLYGMMHREVNNKAGFDYHSKLLMCLDQYGHQKEGRLHGQLGGILLTKRLVSHP